MSKTLKVIYSLSKEDYAIGTTYTYERSRVGKRSLLQMRIMGIILLMLLIGLVDMRLQLETKSIYLLSVIIASIIWWLCANWFHHKTLIRKMKKHVQKNQQADWFEERSMLLTPNYCLFSDEKHKEKVTWDQFQFVTEDAGYLYLYRDHQNGFAYIVPKAHLEDKMAVKSYIQDRISYSEKTP